MNTVINIKLHNRAFRSSILATWREYAQKRASKKTRAKSFLNFLRYKKRLSTKILKDGARIFSEGNLRKIAEANNLPVDILRTYLRLKKHIWIIVALAKQ